MQTPIKFVRPVPKFVVQSNDKLAGWKAPWKSSEAKTWKLPWQHKSAQAPTHQLPVSVVATTPPPPSPQPILQPQPVVIKRMQPAPPPRPVPVPAPAAAPLQPQPQPQPARAVQQDQPVAQVPAPNAITPSFLASLLKQQAQSGTSTRTDQIIKPSNGMMRKSGPSFAAAAPTPGTLKVSFLKG